MDACAEPTSEPAAGHSWAVCDVARSDLFGNLALDEALLIEADRQGGPRTLRFWEFPRLAVVMGASCRRLEHVDVAACRRDGVPIARRGSGGGTVLIGPGALNVTVILPIAEAPAAVDEAQQFVISRFAERLRQDVPGLEVQGSGDLAIAGRKVAGSAQRRLKHWFLAHASILYDLPPETIARYLSAPPSRQPRYRAGRSHEDFITNLPVSRSKLLEALRTAWIPPETATRPAHVPERRVEELLRSKYRDPAWIERF